MFCKKFRNINCREVVDDLVGARQILYARMRTAEADAVHPRPLRRRDAGRGILEHDAFPRVNTQCLSAQSINRGIGLALRQLRTRNHGRERLRQIKLHENRVNDAPPRTRGKRERHPRRPQPGDELQAPRNRLERPADGKLQIMRMLVVHDLLHGYIRAMFFFQHVRKNIDARPPHILREIALVKRQSKMRKRLHLHAAVQRLAVNDDAVHVENKCFHRTSLS